MSNADDRTLRAEHGVTERKEDVSRESELTFAFVPVVAMGCGVSNAAAQTDKYPRMAAIGQYSMEKNAEIQPQTAVQSENGISGVGPNRTTILLR